MSNIRYIDRQFSLRRLGSALRAARKRRGLTQAELALRAGVPRLKVIQVEKGEASVSAGAYADVAAALGIEFSVVPARRPTLDEVAALIADE